MAWPVRSGPSTQLPSSGATAVDFVVFSHLRWDFVYQRPQHLISRAAAGGRVLFVEEPIPGDTPRLGMRVVDPGLTIVQPEMPPTMPRALQDVVLGPMIDHLVREWRADTELVVWHYDVMAEPLSRRLAADVVVFDCMDELAAFRGAPPELPERERNLLRRAQVVFTGGYSLWERKRRQHPNAHCFPSAVDIAHFRAARHPQPQPGALEATRAPRFVYAGVIDERIDMQLLADLAAADIGEVVLVGPVAKIDPATIPASARIHQVGIQPYDALPALFHHADVGIMPFAINEATRFISPTKTPEYLAAGLPVVSTPIHDVAQAYGDLPSVWVADREDFVESCSHALAFRGPDRLADERIAPISWDRTWEAMASLIDEALEDERSVA